MTNKTEAYAAVIAEFNEAIADLESIISNDTILAWNNGLAVRIVDGVASACGIAHATSFGYSLGPNDPAVELPVVTNGHGQVAHPIRRQDAIHFEVKKLRQLIANLEGRAD